MNVIISLDYEVFFGPRVGTVEKTILEPTYEIMRVAQAAGAKIVLFVDAGFLIKLRQNKARDSSLLRDYEGIRRQLEFALEQGHELQLHAHPHWEDSVWEPGGWRLDTSRYRLHDFSDAQIEHLLDEYHRELSEIAGPGHVVAFRGGGWVIQPFDRIAPALSRLGVVIDSTVFPGGTAQSTTHWFDFRASPRTSRWRFESDPLAPVPQGRFLELPIASHTLGPQFFWQLAWTKKFGSSKHQKWGDGEPLPLGKTDLWHKLTGSSTSVVSIDGLKSSFLEPAFRDYRKRGIDDFVVIGHPKMLSAYALEKLREFLAAHRDVTYTGYRGYLKSEPFAVA